MQPRLPARNFEHLWDQNIESPPRLRSWVRFRLPGHVRIGRALRLTRITSFSMRACARLAFVFFALGAGLGLTGCTTIDELKDTMSGWFGTGKSVGEHAGVFPGELPGADRMPPEKILGE